MAAAESILALLESWGYPLFLAGVILEGVPLLGMFVPGQILLVLAGFLAATGRLELGWILLLGIVGGMIGDGFSYYLGTRHGRAFLLKFGPRLIVTEDRLDRAEALLQKYGAGALVLARFNMITRGLAPLLAGMSRIRPVVFWSFNVVGAFVWTFAYVMMGYLFGESFGYFEAIFGRVLLWGLLAAGGIWLLYRLLRTTAVGFTRLDAVLAILGAGATILFARLAALVARGGPVPWLDGALGPAALALAPLAPAFRVWDAVFSRPLVVVGVAAVALLLLYFRRFWDAVVLILGMTSAEILAAALKATFPRAPPPSPVVLDPQYQFPSDEVLASVVFLGLLVYFTWRVLGYQRAWTAFAALAAGAVALTSISRLALRASYPSDVLGGFLVGVAWLCVVLLLAEWIHKGPVTAKPPKPGETVPHAPPQK